ncbi:MAM and LDL-receptor class A domain-containing protein 1-like [Antedon mediterranea]|uniref:MAM and LDL-receptor class A domain-containing protein 1-like n=1 Tax=Antedon mediterranea TaxID=105859 RepID=UPI003AF80086
MCTIKKDKTASARWIRWSGDSAGSVDHTYGNSSGFFMSVYNYGTARLLTKEYTSVFEGGPKCLTFWYKMYKQKTYAADGTIRVYQTYNETHFGEPIWKVTGDLGNVWRPIELDLTSDTDFKIVIEADRRHSTSMSIDDVVITDEKCSGTYSLNPDISCNFEDNLCGYQTDPTVDVDWIRQQADDGMSGDGPDEDHTFGFDYGHYLCVNPNTTPRLSGHRARIISPIQNTTADDYCVLFWYYVSGSNVGKLKVFAEQNNKKALMWNVRGDQRSSWHRGSFQLTNTDDPFRLIFEAIRGSNPSQGAFCFDDVDVLSGICPIHYTTPTPTEPLPTERTWQVKNIDDAGCTFENDTCGYGSYDGMESSWQIMSAYDRTVGPEGHYLGLNKINYNGVRFRTPYIHSTSVSNCLMFYYMCTDYYWCKGRPLSIYIMDQAAGDKQLLIDPIWITNEYKTDHWKKIQIDLPPTNDNFTVVFESMYGRPYIRMFGIDDVVFYDQKCSAVKPEPFKSTIDCDFEGGEMCGYIQRGNRWRRFQGPTPSLGTGPDNDHTFNKAEGHYIYVEASLGRRAGGVTSISTPYIRHINGPMCLKFWYHMYGEDIGSLTVRGKYRLSDMHLWYKTSTPTSEWSLGTIDLNNNAVFDELIKFTFQASSARGAGYKGDIALDDIKLLPNACNSPEPAITHSYCTFKEHPSNKCNYRDYVPNYMWHPWKYQDKTSGTASETSIKISKGVNSFLYADIHEENKNVAIITPEFKYAKRYCLQMLYIIKEDFGLNINFVHHTTSKTLISSLTRQMAPLWAKYTLELETTTPDEQFSIMFEAKIGHAINGFVAIDDVMISKGHCPIPEVMDKIDCSFEKDCAFSTNTSLLNGWQLSDKETHTHKRLPNIDNTYGTPSGHYYFISFRHTQPPTERNFLRTPVVEMTANKRCFQFYYYLNSNAISSLNVYVDDESIKRFPVDPIWSSIGKKGNQWNLVQMDIEQTKGNYSIVFEPRSGGGKHADIAIDDVILLHNKCIKVPEPKWTSTIDCDFESENSCRYKNVRTAKCNWTRHGGKTKTKKTGPSNDHTYILNDEKEGNYMYIETSPPRIPFDSAELSSPLLPASVDSKCLHFWYHMHGNSVSSLEVYRITPALSEKKLLWSKNGEQGDHWRKAILPLNVKRYFKNGSKEIIDHSMKVHFKGIVGYGYEGDIAIDDVKVVIMSCDPPPESPPVNETSCDFENGVTRCGFEENTNEDGSGDDRENVLDWTFFNASSINGNQTISNDTHVVLSQNQSSYIFAKAAELKTGQRVVLTSPDISAGLYNCLHYSYVSTGDFVIDIYTKSSSGKIGMVYALPRRHQSTWRRHRVNILPQEETFTVVFEGVVGRLRTGFMALDDVMIENGKCTTVAVSEAPQTLVNEATEQSKTTDSLSYKITIAFLSVLFAITMILLVLLSIYYWKQLKHPKASDDSTTDNELREKEETDKNAYASFET